MISNKLIDLITRAKNLNLNIPLKQDEIMGVEKELRLIIADDFKILCSYCSYEFIYGFEFIYFGADQNDGVTETTQSWRESINLPHNYLVLADDGTSAILMKIDGDNSSVIWCALEDVLNICNNQPMEYNPTIFPTFTDFYEFLLDEEEKMRAEESS